MSHLPRMPVRFIPENNELLKSQAGVGTASAGAGSVTDYSQSDVVPQTIMSDVYRAPLDRMHGNEMARRYPDGTLDVDNMKHKVLDALHRAKCGMPLNALEELALSVLFPSSFMFYDPSLTGDLAKVNLKVTPDECAQVAQAVAAHLAYQFEYLRFKRQ